MNEKGDSRMKVVISPDTFKGSITARDLCASIRTGIRRAIPDAEIVEIPLADGGEGTVENLVYATKGKTVEVEVTGPLGRRVKAVYGVLGDGKTAVIEMAQASGLPLVPEGERDPLRATSYGTGELIRHALDSGYRNLIVGLGGSATNDGGMGMLRALGVQFYGENGLPLPEGGGSLAELAYLDDSGLDPRVKEVTLTIASDVTNPLCGPNGASAVFGPQKGATSEMVKQLDQGLARLADCIKRQKGIDIRDIPGSGAAGGMGAALLAFFDAAIRPGIEVIMEAVRFENAIRDADLIITGEGKLDSQTLSGKVIAGVTRAARRFSVPVVALCGSVDLNGSQMDHLGIVSAFSIVPGPCPLEEAVRHAADWAAGRAEQIMRLWQCARHRQGGEEG